MTVVFVHGVPETSAVWGPLLAELDRDDVVTLSPPGFGAPVPDGFEPTSDAYRDWLVAELEHLAADGPVDLVGHDWGAGHGLRAATARPDLVRRFVTDIAGTGDPSYEWHDVARIWQTEGAGEEFVGAVAAASVDVRAAMLADAGMPADVARACAEAGGETMGRCILGLYRSAKQPRMTLMADAFRELGSRKPETLVIVADQDHFIGGANRTRRVAEGWHAATIELHGLGHWWMLEDPRRSAAALAHFLT